MTAKEMEEIWAEHIRGEFVAKDVEATLATMVDDAFVNHVPVNSGGKGKAELRAFYRDVFIGSWPDDLEMTTTNRVFGDNQIIEEDHLRFTHKNRMDWFLPGVPATNRIVDVDFVVVVQFRDGKVACERIYWDQATVLRQTGLLGEERADLQVAVPFELRKIGHVVLNVTDLEASVRFYTGVLGLRVSDRYPDSMVPGGMIFLRCNTDHHGVALVGGAQKSGRSSLNHFAFEVGALDEVFRARAWLREHGVSIVFEGRRRAGCQVAVEFTDPDGNNLEIYWNIDQIGTEGRARPAGQWRQARTLEDAVANPVEGQRVPPRAQR
jgi:catechol 2,3-dioxygenase-like lactoylglutathione lyase family enzyme